MYLTSYPLSFLESLSTNVLVRAFWPCIHSWGIHPVSPPLSGSCLLSNLSWGIVAFGDHNISPICYCCHHMLGSTEGWYRKRTKCSTPRTTLLRETQRRKWRFEVKVGKRVSTLCVLNRNRTRKKAFFLLTNWSEMSFLWESKERERWKARQKTTWSHIWGLSSFASRFGSSISSPLLKPTLTLGKHVISRGEANLFWQILELTVPLK